MKARVKVAVQVKEKEIPGWPCIGYEYERELERVLAPVRSLNPQVDFDVVCYTDVKQAEADFENDVRVYDGVLVLLMTCWIKIDVFYARKAKECGLPVIIADVPYCGSGSMLANASVVIRQEELPVPMVSSLDYNDIARAVRLFYVIRKMKDSKILVVSNRTNEKCQDYIMDTWGCTFINKTSADLMPYFNEASQEEAKVIADKWSREAHEIIEPKDADIQESARLYLALKKMKEECLADAVTVDCLTLSYGGQYDNRHMYPCLSHFEMGLRGEVAVCEADIGATVTSLIMLYLCGRPGFVSDPVIDTSSDQIVYAHCVACTNVFGNDDARRCKYNLRSHAEDRLGASVQVIFPAGEKLTTAMLVTPENEASLHSAYSVGNVGGDEGCRSKLAATADTEKLLHNWSPCWHRVTVFGDYRKDFKNLFKIKRIWVNEEDK